VTGDAPLVLAGVSTDCCVLSTALAAADDGRFVQVVADACAGASDEDHQRALDAMALYRPLITITSVAALRASS
jgi:nicotinamidase-related amidase